MGQKGAKSELSSASELLHGMRFPGGKYPGERVVREVRKGPGNERRVVFYGGKVKKLNKKDIAAMARDRGFDLSNYRYRTGPPELKRKMLLGSMQWQKKAKARFIQRLGAKLKTVSSPEKKKRVQAEIMKLRAVRPRSPHTGEKPVSGYLRRYWS